MFIRKSSYGYYRGSEQHSGRGEYLALFAWNPYKAMEEAREGCLDCQLAAKAYRFNVEVQRLRGDAYEFNRAFNAYSTCEKHRGIGLEAPTAFRYANSNCTYLWAIVRTCALHQLGNWMMGSIRLGNSSITVSGSIGNDGLPMDYQAVPKEHRHKLVEVPEEVAKVFWEDHGWNDVGGKARGVLRKWALETFKVRGERRRVYAR